VNKNYYGCSKCNQSFSRKWNADRHNELIHSDLAVIEIKSKPTHDLQTKPKKIVKQNKFKKFTSVRFKIKDDISYEFFSEYVHADANELKTIKIFGQLIKPFEELEKLLEHYDEELKAEILHKIFVSSINSHRPVKSMNDTVVMYRSIFGMEKIAQNTSKHMNVPVEQAKTMLKELVKISPHFNNNIV
jgi:hypothetical protein